MAQPAALSAEDSFAPDMVANAPAIAHVNPKGHIKTAGEKKFDTLTYTWIGYVANALLSVLAVAAVERTPRGQKMMETFRGWAERNVKFVKPETAKMLATKSFFLAGGFLVMPPMKWLEDKKLAMVKKYDQQIYGDAANTDPTIIKSHQEIENAPKQNWKSIIGSRILALVPFYAGYWLLWDKKSPLAKATNDAVFVDRPIVAASRGIGKIFAKLSGNKAAVETITELNKSHAGEMLPVLPEKASRAATVHDPVHAVVPYYFISEAITSGMVAWGVYVLTRVLGPILGTKKQTAPEAKLPNTIDPAAIESAPVITAPQEEQHAHAPKHPHMAADVKEQPEEKISEKKREQPEAPATKVQADTLQHHHTHHHEAAHAHSAH